MGSPWKCAAFIVIHWLSFAAQIYGELIMIRHPPKIQNGTIVQDLSCISEADGSALVWNEESLDSSYDADFRKTCAELRTCEEAPNIKFNSTAGWESINSVARPMGPVFDHRWEGFRKYAFRNGQLRHRFHIPGFDETGTVVISVRGSRDIYFSLDVENILGNNSCYSYMIAGSKSTKSQIHSCDDEVSQASDGDSQTSNRSSVNALEWRTYIIKLNRTGTIEVFRNTENIFQEKVDEWANIGDIVVRNLYGNPYGRSWFRFYDYEYYFTQENARDITASEIHCKEQNLYVQLIVSLCSVCQLKVLVTDKNGTELGTETINGDKQVLGFPLRSWKIEKLNISLGKKHYENPISLTLSTIKVNQSSDSEIWWAIGGVETYKPGDTRKSTKTFHSSNNMTDVTCQKLSYTENERLIVHSNSKISNINLTNLHYYLGEEGKFCNNTNHNYSCKGTSVCNQNGCICAPGFKGNNCDEECLPGYHGYNCQKSCGHCKTGTCDKTTGKCSRSECEDHYLPPDCKIRDSLEESAKKPLIWLVVIPILAICGVLAYVLYRKYNTVSLKIRAPPVRFINDAALVPIVEQAEPPFDSCVPPEVQKYRIFENYVKRAAENGVLQQQFLLLPKGLLRSCECGRLPNNKPKNGYGNLIAYDETRVLLVRDSRGINSDYINANYVQGYCKEKAYIATQAPLPDTIIDFWRMIWQEEVRIICMLVDLNMCERYWPEVGEEMSYGDVSILTTNQRVFADYTYRTFLVTTSHGIESQVVQHLHYTGWPDEGVPMYSHSVVEYLQKLLSVAPGQGPIVVHCSSGTGRTGTIILTDIVMRRLAAEGTVDVFSEAKKMYSARPNMLNNYAQYVLAHLVPTQCLLMTPTKVLCADVTQEKINEMKTEVPMHITRIEECSWMDKALRPLEPIRPLNPENIGKNRFPKFTPVGPSLVSLTRSPLHDNNSEYISAVSVDGVKIRKQYIASQLPLPETVTDFWRLILEQNIELVIILQDPDPKDPSCAPIIPYGEPIAPVCYLKVETKTSSRCGRYYTTDKLLLTDTSKEPARMRNITALTCHSWSSDQDEPPAHEILVELWRASERIQREGPTLVLCHDGVMGCGLFLALSFMLERMAVEQECDVVLAARAVRRSRTEFMSSQWQFEYLYDAAVKYAESFQDYGNFNGAAGANQWYHDQ